jgi:glutathione S-transferase
LSGVWRFESDIRREEG